MDSLSTRFDWLLFERWDLLEKKFCQCCRGVVLKVRIKPFLWFSREVYYKGSGTIWHKYNPDTKKVIYRCDTPEDYNLTMLSKSFCACG